MGIEQGNAFGLNNWAKCVAQFANGRPSTTKIRPSRSLVESAYTYLMGGIGRRCGLHLVRMFCRPMDGSVRSLPLQGFDIRSLTEAELLALCSDTELNLVADEVRDAVGRGSVCIGAFEAERLAGYAWFAERPSPHGKGLWVKIPSQAIYKYKVFVRESSRGMGIAPALDRYADVICRDSGRQYQASFISSHNISSMSASRASGGMSNGFVAYWRTDNHFFVYHSGKVRRFGLLYYKE